MSDARQITLEINQQQAEMLDRLIAQGGHGSTYAEVIRSGFVAFCRDHPELGAAAPAQAGSRE